MATNYYPTFADPLSFTITLASLADGGYRQSTGIDIAAQSVPLADGLVAGKIVTGGAPAATGQVKIYAVGSVDGGTTYGGGASGSDGAYSTPDTPTLNNLGQPLVILAADSTAAQTFYLPIRSLTRHFGGILLPAFVALIVHNDTGDALAASGHDIQFQGIIPQSAVAA